MFSNVLFFPNCQNHESILIKKEIDYVKIRISTINKGIDDCICKWEQRYNDMYTSGKMKRDIDEKVLMIMNEKLIKNINRLNELCERAA